MCFKILNGWVALELVIGKKENLLHYPWNEVCIIAPDSLVEMTQIYDSVQWFSFYYMNKYSSNGEIWEAPPKLTGQCWTVGELRKVCRALPGAVDGDKHSETSLWPLDVCDWLLLPLRANQAFSMAPAGESANGGHWSLITSVFPRNTVVTRVHI